MVLRAVAADCQDEEKPIFHRATLSPGKYGYRSFRIHWLGTRLWEAELQAASTGYNNVIIPLSVRCQQKTCVV